MLLLPRKINRYHASQLVSMHAPPNLSSTPGHVVNINAKTALITLLPSVSGGQWLEMVVFLSFFFFFLHVQSEILVWNYAHWGHNHKTCLNLIFLHVQYAVLKVRIFLCSFFFLWTAIFCFTKDKTAIMWSSRGWTQANWKKMYDLLYKLRWLNGIFIL